MAKSINHRKDTPMKATHKQNLLAAAPHASARSSGIQVLPIVLPAEYVREAPAGFGLERLATAFMNNPG